MDENFDKKLLDNIFKEIKQGFSQINFEGALFYIKHPGQNEIEFLNLEYERFFNKSTSQGVMTEKELANLLDEQAVWTKEEEKDLNGKEIELNNLKKTLGVLFLEKEMNPIEKRIKELAKKVESLKERKEPLFKNSAEKYASKKSNERFILNSLYKDKELTQLMFSNEEADELSQIEISEIYQNYNESLKKFSEKNLKQLSVEGVFTGVLSLFGENVSNFFKVHHLDLSYYQINLLNYGKLFLNIFENKEIPKDIRNNAQKILDFLNESKNKKKKLEEVSQKSSQSDGFSYVGASKSDLKKMGVDFTGTKDISQIADEKGGELNMEDFIEMHKK